jgi:hypothetical protein
MDPDHPGSSSAFTAEGKLDAQCAKERLRATQSFWDWRITAASVREIEIANWPSSTRWSMEA